MGEIMTTDEFSDWFCGLGDDQAKAIVHVVDASALRVIYAYSPEQNAVLLIAGDKAGNPRFYQEIIPKAERIWRQYLKERAEELRRSRIAEPPRRR